MIPAIRSRLIDAHGTKSLLRFLTCGSVDDGKSTLIGRLLYDSQLLPEDHRAALEVTSRQRGLASGDLDFALVVDGLEAEREQGITIDVAYRFFTTNRRQFIVADTPGHEQYTRNMATGAANSDLAILLVDARKGLLEQTRRHAYIASLLGIEHVVLAVNKVDLVGHSQAVFDRLAGEFRAFAERLAFRTMVPIPVSARFGDNVYVRSEHTPWYEGPSLIEHLEAVDVDVTKADRPFRLSVQWVNRVEPDFRGFAGTASAGRVNLGDTVVVARSGRRSTVRRIVTADGDLEQALFGEAITLVLEDEIDVSIGDVLSREEDRPDVADQFTAHVLWMAEGPLLPGRQYLLKSGAQTVLAHITLLKHKVDPNNLGHLAARQLEMNEVGCANFSLAMPIAFDPYRDNHDTGAFILIDRFSNRTVGAGMIDFALRRASNVHWQALDVDQAMRATMKRQKPIVLWFTGLSGAGKSTIANLVERALAAEGRHTYLLDGDNVRHGLNRDLGFTDADRVENVRRVAEVARLLVDAGLIVLVSLISPFRSERLGARGLLADGQFVEVFVDTPLDVCIARDPKGLYRKARSGQIKHLTGVDSVYEPPEAAEITLETVGNDPAELADAVVRYLGERGGPSG